jgi:hypothetical protein
MPAIRVTQEQKQRWDKHLKAVSRHSKDKRIVDQYNEGGFTAVIASKGMRN